MIRLFIVIAVIMGFITYIAFETNVYTGEPVASPETRSLLVTINIILALLFVLIPVAVKVVPIAIEKRRYRKQKEALYRWREEELLKIKEELRQIELEREEYKRYLASLSPEELDELRKQEEEDNRRAEEEARLEKERREVERPKRETSAVSQRKEQEVKEAKKKQADEEDAKAKLIVQKAKEEERKIKEAEQKKIREEQIAKQKAEQKAKLNMNSRTAGTTCCATCEYWEGVREVGNLARTLVNFPINPPGKCHRPGTSLAGETRTGAQNCGKIYKKWVMLR